MFETNYDIFCLSSSVSRFKKQEKYGEETEGSIWLVNVCV